MGAVRTTFAMVAASLVRRKQVVAKGLPDPYLVPRGVVGGVGMSPAPSGSGASPGVNGSGLGTVCPFLLGLTSCLDVNADGNAVMCCSLLRR